MGRHRTHRAKVKKITNIHKKLNNKRNRDVKIRNARAEHVSRKTEKMKAVQKVLDSFGESAITKGVDQTTQNVKKTISEKFIQRVEAAKETYDHLTNAADKCNGLIEVLDARDPQSFRFLKIEGEIRHNNRPIFLVLTKIDYVPLSSLEQWIPYLSKFGTVLAVDLTKPELAQPALSALVGDLTDIAVTGAPGVGKTTICNLLGAERCIDVPKWQWTNCSPSLALTQSIEWKGRVRELCVDILTRIHDPAFYATLGVKSQLSSGSVITPGQALHDFAQARGVSKQDAPSVLVDMFINGELKWYASAPPIEGEVSPEQKAILEASCPPNEGFVVLVDPGATISEDTAALSYEPPVSEFTDSEDESE